MSILPSQSIAPFSFPEKTKVRAQILLVDDDEQLRELLALLVRHHGYTVETVGNGRAALDYLAIHPVSLVITDLCMPGFDGIELLSALRHRVPCPRLIAMSGSGDLSLSDSLRAAGQLQVDRKLSKPFCIEELLKCIREVLALRELDLTCTEQAICAFRAREGQG